MKTCNLCGEMRPTSEFHRHARTRDKLDARCKSCKRAWAEANRAHIRDARSAYYLANRDRLDARSRAYHEENPHVRWLSRYIVRCRRYGITPAVVPFTGVDLIARYGDACFHCGGPFEELDHHPVPVAHGGEHSLDNCVPSCAACNRRTGVAIRANRTSIPRTTDHIKEHSMPHISLTPAKYAAHSKALADFRSNPEATVDDLWRLSDALGIPAADLMRMREAK